MSERIVKCTVTADNESMKMRESQLSLEGGEVRDEIEHMEPYGFTSRPHVDGQTDALALFLDDSRSLGVVICVADRRYRVTNLKAGEVCLFDDLGRKVHLKREGILIDGASSPITINTSASVTVNASSSVNVNTGNVNINASETTISGHVTINGGLNVSGGSGAQVDGAIAATGDITAGSISVQNHVHGGIQPGGSTTDKAQ